MKVELFSSSLAKRTRAGQPEVFQYDDLPRPFRVQVIHIWNEIFGDYGFTDPYGMDAYQPNSANQWWEYLHRAMIRELGVFKLSDSNSPAQQCCDFVLQAEVLRALDIIDLSVRLIHRGLRRDHNLQARCDAAIVELNERFREHHLGYEITDGRLIRKDSEFIHSNVVKPALLLLSDEAFRGADEEFRKAHEHYRNGNHKDAMVWALKAFESTLKSIFAKRKWTYDQDRDTAQKLIEVALKNELIPTYFTTQFPAFRAMLESGVPTVRNREAGHGQGPEPTQVPPHLVQWTLHSAAANIVMLIEADKALP